MEAKFLTVLIAQISALLVKTNGSTFLGLQYKNKNNEIANHVVIANASYFNACNRAIEILKSISNEMFEVIAEKFAVNNISGLQYSNNAAGREYLSTGKLPKEGTKARENVLNSILISKTLEEVRNDMINSILKNRDFETASAQSIASKEAYEYLESGLKVHKESGDIHIFAKAHSKKILEEGEYSESTMYPETAQKNAISRFCKLYLNSELPNEQFRNFKVNLEQLKRLKVNGNEIIVINE